MLAGYRQQTYALMRIVIGFLFLWHGLSKLFGIPVPVPAGVPAFVLYIAGPIELIGWVLVMVGFMTRWAAFLCSGMMAVAYFQFHWKLELGSRVFPIVNGGELAVIYCFVFLLVAARGAGIWSLDRARGRA